MRTEKMLPNSHSALHGEFAGELGVALGGGELGGRAAVLVARGRVAARLEQHRRERALAEQRGVVQRRRALRVEGVGARARRQPQFDGVALLGVDGVVQRRQPVGVDRVALPGRKPASPAPARAASKTFAGSPRLSAPRPAIR